MVAGLAGVPGPAVISAVVAGAPYALALVPALPPRMVGRSVKERRTRSNPATPNPAVRQTQHVHTSLLSLDCYDPKHSSPCATTVLINSAYGRFSRYVFVFKKSAQPVISILGEARYVKKMPAASWENS